MARTSAIVQRLKAERDAARLVFPSPFEWHSRDPFTLSELRMRKLCGTILAKPRWWEKIHDDALVAKWCAEMVEIDHAMIAREWTPKTEADDEIYYNPVKRWPHAPLTDAQLDFVFATLKHLASQRDRETGIHPTSVHGVHQSASLIPAEVKEILLRGVAALESVPDDEKDWHPGSNGQVLDLVHPSLYCIRIGKSKILHNVGVEGGATVKDYTVDDYLACRPDFEGSDSKIISGDYQWLPTDFSISEAGDVECRGYINNLHPITHRQLYPAITSVLQRFVPMFERVLSDALSPEPPLVIQVDPLHWYEHLGEPDYEDDEAYERWYATREPLIPDAPPFEPPSNEGRINVDLRGSTVQVIVKLANIVLTPENPTYPGGSWHVEGMLNERIVATGLYYYSCENITESRLAFRVQVGTDPDGFGMKYEQNDNKGYERAFGFSNEDPLNQELGHIVAAEDKCVAFPNIYQHRVEPFELADPTRPGHRKILCFFLVDPKNKVDSTSVIPPQQREWYEAEMRRIPALRALPTELYDMIAAYVFDGTITREEAEADRARLMEERKEFVLGLNEDVFEVAFSLCEH